MRAFLGSRWVGWALVASLAANLFLAGVIGVRYWREHERDRSERAELAQLGPIGRVAGALPESGREKVRAALDARRQEFRERGREFRRARAEAIQSISAETYDRARADAAFAEARKRADAMAEIIQAVMIDASSKLTPEERKAFRERLAERERDRERRGPPPPRN